MLLEKELNNYAAMNRRDNDTIFQLDKLQAKQDREISKPDISSINVIPKNNRPENRPRPHPKHRSPKPPRQRWLRGRIARYPKTAAKQPPKDCPRRDFSPDKSPHGLPDPAAQSKIGLESISAKIVLVLRRKAEDVGICSVDRSEKADYRSKETGAVSE